MALNGNTLGDTIANILTDETASPEARAQVKAIWERIGTAIVNHIKTNASVTVSAGITVTTDPTTGQGATTTTGSGSIS